MAEMNTYHQDIKNAASVDLPWEKLQGANILITGATGLIGGCLVDVMMARTDRTFKVFAAGRNMERAKTRFSKYLNDNGFCLMTYDVTKPLQSDIDFHYIIHAASDASPNAFASKPVEVMQSNIYGTDNLLSYGINHGLRRFLYVSSGEVYGEGDGRVFTEDYSGYVNGTTSRACYPMGKRAAETLCVAYSDEYGIDTVIARPCHTYGPYFTENDNRVYAQFIRNVLNDEDIIMKSTGEQYRSWCYVVDCAKAILYILLKGERCNAYNIADENSNITIRELAEIIANNQGKQVVIQLSEESERKGFSVISKAVFSTEKLKQLDWSIEGDMKSKIQTTISVCKIKS